MSRLLTAFSLALIVMSVWNASACALICANDDAAARPPGTPAHRSGQCHEGRSLGHQGAGSKEQSCPREVCARLQPALQTSRPAEIAAPHDAGQPSFFPETPSGIRAELTASGGRTLVFDHCLGPPVPPSLFTILRT